jgi:hypothetical protein
VTVGSCVQLQHAPLYLSWVCASCLNGDHATGRHYQRISTNCLSGNKLGSLIPKGRLTFPVNDAVSPLFPKQLEQTYMWLDALLSWCRQQLNYANVRSWWSLRCVCFGNGCRAEGPNQKLVLYRNRPDVEGGGGRRNSHNGHWVRRSGRKEDKCCGSRDPDQRALQGRVMVACKTCYWQLQGGLAVGR